MRKNKIKKFLTGALAIGVLTTTSITPAFASDLSNTKNKEITSTTEKSTSLSQEDKETLNNWLKQNDVNAGTRTLLLDKLEKGQLWDSVTSNSPIETKKLGDNTTKDTYADGSIAISGINDSTPSTSSKKEDILLKSVDPGKVESGSGYQTHTYSKVYRDVGIINIYFYADYTLVNGGMDYISDAYDEYVHSVILKISNISLTVNRPTETYNHNAEATLKFLGDSAYGASGTLYLKLVVGNDRAYSQDKLD